MNKLLYIVAGVLVIIWAIGILGFRLDKIIHILLVLAVISALVGIVNGKYTNKID